MRRWCVLLIAALLAACAQQPPGPSPSSTLVPSLRPPPGTVPPPTALAPPPPPAVQAAVFEAQIVFTPLSADQLATVRIPVNAAEQAALKVRNTAYGSPETMIIWKKVGCVFLGLYTEPSIVQGHAESMAPPVPAYLVQVLTDQIPDFPTMNIAVVVIDAVTGKVGLTWGGNATPLGILGSTCGVTP